MNIKQHIEAGHYPKDEKGRALVPMQHRGTATIYATDRGGRYCIVGVITGDICAPPVTWSEEGSHKSWAVDARDLMPPPPRKVKHMATLCIPWDRISDKRDGKRKPSIELGDITSCGEDNKEWKYVLLTGETEEPWE